MTTKNLGTLISKITRETIGVDVSPHLFRTAGHQQPPSTGANIRISPARFLTTVTPASPKNTTIVRWGSALAKSMPASLTYIVSPKLGTEIFAPRCGERSSSEVSARTRGKIGNFRGLTNHQRKLDTDKR